MPVTISFDACNSEDCEKVLALLGAKASPTVTKLVEVEKVEDKPVEAPAPKKRGRPAGEKKEPVEKEEVVQKEPTKDDLDAKEKLRGRLLSLKIKMGRDELMGLLARYGGEKLDDIKPSDYQAIYDEAGDILSANEI